MFIKYVYVYITVCTYLCALAYVTVCIHTQFKLTKSLALDSRGKCLMVSYEPSPTLQVISSRH